MKTFGLVVPAGKGSTFEANVRARLAAVFGSEVAMAGADATFNTALTAFTGFLEGSGGKIITVLSLAGDIVGFALGRFSLARVAIPVGVGVDAGTGVPIVTCYLESYLANVMPPSQYSEAPFSY